MDRPRHEEQSTKDKDLALLWNFRKFGKPGRDRFLDTLGEIGIMRAPARFTVTRSQRSGCSRQFTLVRQQEKLDL
jgi:hypothetical protein